MKISKKVFISVLTLIFIISMITTVNAATGSISVSASAKQVVKGNTFTVTIAGTADENITALQAALSYDNTKLSLENKAPGTGFSEASGSNSEIAVLSTDNDSLSKSGTLYTLTFKVLDTATEGDTTITVSGATLAVVNDSKVQEDLSVTDGTATVTIKSDDTTAGSDKNTVDNSSNNDSKNDVNTNKSNTSTSGKEKLPQTGSEVVSIVAIAGLAIFAVVSYISYKRYKNI